mmetsp:Transcript_31971/g.35608  ORF Transcript_31971/g.35608 Transcript_31971/m.35608 type:complete len:81 (-) Transcript_31971:15-257(-)
MSGDFPQKILCHITTQQRHFSSKSPKRMNTDKEFLVSLFVLMSQTHKKETSPMINKKLSNLSDSINGSRQQIHQCKDDNF